ncbi:hypothetical protein [Natrinema sp. CBA1119]|uniref:hypothetical protein n=1 Tax=Natrinema sp. CBA1119 TaxID=1608465 RepID=UPI001145D9CB|nr:hypothetical protein [Natrinema sp. CBA1119]
MSSPADHLRSAVDSINDARIDLDHGDLEVPDDELQRQVAGLDDVAHDLEDTLREIAILAEVEEVDGE